MISTASLETLERPGDDSRAFVASAPLLTRVWHTFARPRHLFERLGPRSPWIGVLMISTAVAMLAAVNQPPEFFLAQMEDPVNRLGRPVEVTSGPDAIVRYGRYLAALSALAAHPLIAFALGGAVTLLFTVIGKGHGTFRHYLVAASHVLLIWALGTLVTLGLRVATSDAYAEPTLARALSFAGTAVAGNAFLAGINLFSIWTLCVLAVAVSRYDGKRSLPQATAILLACYLVLAGVSAALA